jgi:hypothetical protein
VDEIVSRDLIAWIEAVEVEPHASKLFSAIGRERLSASSASHRRRLSANRASNPLSLESAWASDAIAAGSARAEDSRMRAISNASDQPSRRASTTRSGSRACVIRRASLSTLE